jgi:hypothetical protein
MGQHVKEGSFPQPKKLNVDPEDHVTEYRPDDSEDCKRRNKGKSGDTGGRVLSRDGIPTESGTKGDEFDSSEEVRDTNVHPE